MTALTASANICHFQRSQILDLMCLNWFSPAWHCLSDCHSPPWLTFTVSLAPRPANITGRQCRWRRMDWSRKSSRRWPLSDLLHDTISPKWQKWRRIMCFKVKHGRDKTQQAPVKRMKKSLRRYHHTHVEAYLRSKDRFSMGRHRLAFYKIWFLKKETLLTPKCVHGYYGVQAKVGPAISLPLLPGTFTCVVGNLSTTTATKMDLLSSL